jgi:hypothetical protein
MTDPYQDPDPVSSNRTKKQARKDSTGESKRRFRNPFARSKNETKTTTSPFLAANASMPFSNPFTTEEDDSTLVDQEVSHDLDAEFHDSTGPWKFRLKEHKASAPASDVGVYACATSVDDRNAFAELMEKTRGMTPEQVAEFLRARDKVDGEKIMNGRKGSGYQMLAGPFMGTM